MNNKKIHYNIIGLVIDLIIYYIYVCVLNKSMLIFLVYHCIWWILWYFIFIKLYGPLIIKKNKNE